MEELTEKRVWQRVRGETDRTERLRRLLEEQGRLWGAYRNFARRGGKWRRLLEQKQTQIACLRGLLRILTGQGAAHPRAVTGAEDLTACFRLEEALLEELTDLGRTGDRAAMFALLAEGQKHQCRLLLELMGNL